MAKESAQEVTLVNIFGLGIVYYKGREHGVGVIAPPLLPASYLRYRVHFSFLQQSGVGGGGGFTIPLTSGALLGSFFSFDSGTTKRSYAFDLRFLSSRPRFNKIIKATSEDVANGYLTTSKNIVMVGYVVKLTPNTDDGIILSITDAEEDIPGKPRGQSVYEDDYFNYYQEFRDQSFVAGDITFQTNLYDKLLPPPGHNFRLKRSRYFDRDSTSNMVIIKGGVVEDTYYAITYEEADEYYYSQFHSIGMAFLSISIVPGIGFDFPSIRPSNSPMIFYSYREWVSPTGEAMRGWRASEAWWGGNYQTKAYTLDESGNVKSDPEVTYEHIFYNMVQESLVKPDSQRVGYLDVITEQYVELANNSNEISQPGTFDPDNLRPDDITSNNFEIYQSTDKRIVGGTYINPSANVVFDDHGAPSFVSAGGQVFGYWESDFHVKSFGKNTRIILAFDSGSSKNTYMTFGSRSETNVLAQSSAQDPLYFGIIDGKLHYYIFGDSTFDLDLPVFVRDSLASREEKFGSSVHLGTENDGGTGSSVILEEYSYKTFIDDSQVSETPENPEEVATVTAISSNNISASIDESSEDTYVISVSSDEIILEVFFSIGEEGDSPVKIRGWKNKPEEIGVQNLLNADDVPFYEKSSVYKTSGDVSIKVNGWEGISFIEIIGCSGISNYNVLNDEISPHNFINNADSVACSVGSRGILSCFYTTEGGRMNLLISNNFGISWNNYENIFMRGGRMSGLRSIVNNESDEMKIFHYYKNSILMVSLQLSVVNFNISDVDTNSRLLDQIRTQEAYLIMGDIDSEEGIKDNMILTQEDSEAFLETRVTSEDIISQNGDYQVDFDLSVSNKFIKLGSITKANKLSRENAPSDIDYTVFENKKGVLRMLIKNDDDEIRCLESGNDGLDWYNYWEVGESIDEDSKVKINSLKPVDDEDIDEAVFLSAIYNEIERRVYIFYCFRTAILVKPVDEDVFFNNETQADFAKLFNSLQIYFVCGELNSVEAFKPDADSDEDVEGSSIFFNEFQLNEDYKEQFYNEEKYVNQHVTGYATKKGYMRVFLVNNNKTIDSYYYDGIQWYPENVMLLPA
jgi:hypothetical protein